MATMATDAEQPLLDKASDNWDVASRHSIHNADIHNDGSHHEDYEYDAYDHDDVHDRRATDEYTDHDRESDHSISESSQTSAFSDINDDEGPAASCLEELVNLIKLTLPIFVAMVAWVAMKTTDTALLGHVSTEKLSAASYSDLWTQSTGVFVTARVLGIFASQAYGAGNRKLVGVWLQVSYTVLFFVAIPVALCWALTGPVLRLFGVNDSEAKDAWYYSWVLATCLPARIAASQLAQFFQSQRIMHPAVVASAIAMLFNLLLGLVLVLGIPFKNWTGYGFPACPIITAAMEYLQLAIVVVVFVLGQRLHTDCWAGWDPSAVTWTRVCKFVQMYVPAALAIGSDFWRLSVIGVLAAAMDSTDLAVFNSSYRIMWMCLTLCGSLGGAVGITLAISLGRGDTVRSQLVTKIGIGLALSILAVLSLLVFSFPRQLGSIFSSDPLVLDKYEDIRLPLAVVALVMNFSVVLERIPMSMGRTREVLVLGLIGSWGGQVPGVLLCTRLWRNDLYGLYSGVACGYLLLCGLYLVLILRTNWQRFADEARARSEMPSKSEGILQ